MPIAEARQRLTKEYKNLNKSPLPYITARPNESNILEWHYIIDGPPDTPYFNGQYHGVITFTTSYPYAPPSIRMYTPSGRFKPRARLCLSISDFHPESWNPGWSVSTILNGLLSFMTSEDITTGSITTSYETKLQCARDSMQFNLLRNAEFCKVFPEYAQSNTTLMHQKLEEIDNYQQERRRGNLDLQKLRFQNATTDLIAQNAIPKNESSVEEKKLSVVDKKKMNEDEIRAKKNQINKTDSASFNRILIAIAVVVIGFSLKLFYM